MKSKKKTKTKKKINPISETEETNEQIFEGLDIEESEFESEKDFEQNIEFIKQVEEFEKHHKNAKLITVYKYIGEPEIPEISHEKKITKEEYDSVLDLLDTHRIYIHFQDEYTLDIKYKFLIEEIFKQEIEDISGTNLHITFVYEDFHPEIEEDQF